MKSQSYDILAKLLATENVSVVRKNVHTASFDIVNRVLSLPVWKNLTPEIEEMLILHEVGHALYTTEKGYVELLTDKKHLFAYANIIEDVRIEKKMKERYPGSRKSFNAGYTQLNARDFFGVKGRDLNECVLIDRINLFYKVGFNAGIPFTEEEYEFVRRTDQCVTEEDVIKLAEEIFNFSKEKIQEEEATTIEITTNDEVDGDEEGDDILKSSADSSVSHKEKPLTAEQFEDLAPKTNDKFNKKLSSVVDVSTRLQYFDAKFKKTGNTNIIVGYKKILSQRNDSDDLNNQKATEFTSSNFGIVNYLVKEFEMRKSADAYKRTKISRIGQLDTRKLFAYKIKEDLFKQISVVQDGKKHGMIFLLDWSGSMYNCIEDTVKQVIVLAMFCQKINIPYQVLAFTDTYYEGDQSYTYHPAKTNDTGIASDYDFNLLELFSHNMNSKSFNDMIKFLLNRPWNRYNQFSLNGTPLNHALLFMVDYVGKFIKENNVQKMNIISLTDGESNSLGDIVEGSRYENGNTVRVNSILRDPVTRKEYHIGRSSFEQTVPLMNLLKDRYGAKMIGFFLTENRLSNISRFIRHNVDESKRSQFDVNKIQTEIRSKHASILKNVSGRDELYLISSSSKIVDTDLQDVNDSMNATQISKELGKMFNSSKKSRFVLNSFISLVA